MSQDDLRHEDETILAALAALEDRVHGRDGAAAADLRGTPESETLRRLYDEVLGLIPCELEPMAPSEDVRKRLLAAIAGDETQEVEPGVPAAAAAPRSPSPVPVPAPSPPPPLEAVRTSWERSAPLPPPAAAPRRREPRRWPLALAAGLILALLGASAWLYTGLVQQSGEISRLAQDLQAERRRVQELERGNAELAALKDRLDLMVSPAVEVCSLRPPAESPVQQARGVLFVAADHQHWYISVQGLEPAGPGRSYQLWFINEAGPVSAGTFDAEPGSPVDLSSETMPAGTRAVAITIEPEEGAPQPTGPAVLRDAGIFQVL